MPQEALPFATPSEPGGDPLADAIERALQDAGLRADGGVGIASSAEPDAPTAADAVAPDSRGDDDS